MKKLLAVIAALIMILTLCSCSGGTESPEGSEGTTSEAAEETSAAVGVLEEDTTIGEGSLELTVKVVTEDKTLTLTVLTDATVLGDALIENGLVEGEEGPYGLYIKKVNGISAVYETDGAYWSLLVNGETALTGADGIETEDGAVYELVYTKA